MNSPHSITAPLKTLLRGEPDDLAEMLRHHSASTVLRPCVVAIVIGCGMYGASLGLWRAPLMAFFVGLKMPLLIFLTLMVNGLLNGILALVLGSGLSFRQTLTACLMCFAIFAMLVGSLSPIVIGMVLDAPPAGQPGAESWYRMFLLMHTAVIAFAGIVSNHKLLRLLQSFAGSPAIGWRTLIAWLAGNLFVGAQLSYNLRPFFGNPDLPVQLVRDNPFDGNFYIAVWSMMQPALGPVLFAAGGLLCVSLPFIVLILFTKRPLSATSDSSKP